MIQVLFIHPAGTFGGASKSLIELYRELNKSSVKGVALCPVGSVVKSFSDEGLEVICARGMSQFDNTRFGHYRGVRWLILLRELFLFPFTLFALRKLLKNREFDVIHFNEATLFPWLRLARCWSSASIVVHVRSLQRGGYNDFRTRWFNRTIRERADKVIAIDETVRRTLPKNLDVSVVHNGLRVAHIEKNQGKKVFRVGIVGVLLKLKGVYEFIEAARILVNERQLDIEFYIVGENARKLTGWRSRLLRRLDFAHDVRSDIESFIQEHGLEENVTLTGFVDNVQEVYSSLDVLCFPSHLNAAGRPVFEAAFYSVPSVVAVRNPPRDTIIDKETGLCIEKPDSKLLANAIEKLYKDPSLLRQLGENANRLAKENFDIEKNAAKLLTIYKDL